MSPALLQRLSAPSLYPGGIREVEIIQTHLSVVALAGDCAYKFKKPVKLPFADFSTLERRERFCREELRLNRRLCPELYLDVVALRGPSLGESSFSGDGPVLEYAVRMRRLDESRLLDRLLASGEVEASAIAEVARQVCAFHRGAERGEEVARLGAPEPLRDHALGNFEETRPFLDEILPRRLHAALERRAAEDFARLLPLLSARAERGCVVDGHGDLHARNICLEDPPVIFDCIEFDPCLRCGDTASEHAFLLMDLRFRGRRDLAEVYLKTVLEEDGDAEIPSLLPALMQYRALVRSKVASIAAREPGGDGPEEEGARAEARRYLRLAGALAAEEDGPLWIAFHGLPGTGKTSLAAELAGIGSWPVLSSDLIRKELAGRNEGEKLPESCYSAEFNHRTYATLLERAEAASSREPVLLLDANFRRREERLRLRESSRRCGARLVLVSLSAEEDEDEGVVRQRLERRGTDPRATDAAREAPGQTTDASDADWDVYRKLKVQTEPPSSAEVDLLLALDATLESEELVDEALASLI